MLLKEKDMTGLDNIIKKIDNDADRVIEQVNKDAEKEITQILNNAQKELDEKREIMQRKAQTDSNLKKERLISMAKLEGSKSVLQTKRELINRVYDKVYKVFNDMPSDEYEKLLVQQIVNTNPPSSGSIRLSETDSKRISADFARKVNEEFKNRGKNVTFSLDHINANIKGGFVLICGDIELNGSLEKMIEFNKSDYEPIISNTLF